MSYPKGLYLLAVASVCMFSCKKELKNDESISKKTATEFQNIYFDTKSNSTLDIPKKFPSMAEAIGLI